jgi:hypothetical protein
MGYFDNFGAKFGDPRPGEETTPFRQPGANLVPQAAAAPHPDLTRGSGGDFEGR